LVIILIATFSCADKETNYMFMKSQSATIMSYQQQGYYEYNSRLNHSMWEELQSFETDLLSQTTYETIKSLDLKIKSKKLDMGCYIIPWRHKDKSLNQDDIIMLEWNPNAGVIIRVFTKSELVKELLPLQSF